VKTKTREWLTVPEVAEELKIPRSRAYDLCARGELPAVRIGERSIRVNRRELERFLLETRQIVASQTERPHSGPKTRGERF
jgi:excisionase family DNA binding protein